ncbi:MAG: hypothetical protein WCG66_10800 [bacterium]
MTSELQDPAYLHLLLNHVPIIGMAMGVLALLVGLGLRQRSALLPGLAIVLLSGISAWPVYVTGEAAYKPIRKISDYEGSDWLDEHMERAEQTIWVFYATAGLACLAIGLPRRWPTAGVPLAAASLIAAIACTGVSAFIAKPGGLVRHSEFRPRPAGSNPEQIPKKADEEMSESRQ